METRSAFRIFWICGLASVLVDFDHAYSVAIHYAFYPSVVEGRILHPLIFLIVCCLLGYLSAYLGRLYCKLVLERGKSRK